MTENTIDKEKGHKDNDPRNTTEEGKYSATLTHHNIGGEFGCFGRVSSSCSTNCIRRVTLATNRMISHKREYECRIATTINRTYM